MSKIYDVIIIGAGAAGLMCAITAASRGRKVLVLDHANKIGKKILMSGGGRCNFTNMYVEANNYLSNNPHFVKSALQQYTQWDFISLVCSHEIPYHEKSQGQLFCDNKSSDILNMLQDECERAGAEIRVDTQVTAIEKHASNFSLKANTVACQCESLVIATGGYSIPTMGATGFGFDVAQQFGLEILPTRAALVPFIFTDEHKPVFSELSGTSQTVVASCNKQSFSEELLFTHRGLSGPSMLQISNYWREGDFLALDLLPSQNAAEYFLQEKTSNPQKKLVQLLAEFWPKKTAELLLPLLCKQSEISNLSNKSLQECKISELQALAEQINDWQLRPAGTEGYRTAEVTLGGLNTDQLSSKTMMSKDIDGLFFIGEVADVTGHLGGFNFQWAWSSGFVAGQNA